MDKEHEHRLTLPPLSAASPEPFYAQIVEGVRREVGAGRLAPHTALPSYRELAAELLVSLITVKRAYEELERAGVIYRRQGLGTFVAEQGVERSRGAKMEQAEALLHRAVREGREAGMRDTQILDALRRALREE